MYILLILFSTTVDYVVTHQMVRKEPLISKKGLLLTSLFVNLGLLFIFKYYNFFNQSVATLLNNIGLQYDPSVSSLLLPVGISFYTFQTLSYTIDVYYGKLKPEKHFGKFALYVSFFPQLVAGPIERATNFLPQLKKSKHSITYHNIASGSTQFIIGLFKKVVVADSAALYVDSIFNNYHHHTGLTLILATYFFAIQIYCDFSGYSDMAIGVARMLGYDLMENFRIPYFSKNVTEFWRRWHISLSSWLRDYLYIPLGGNRFGKFMTYRNLMLTMLLGGLWHGASWNFVIWGFLNGLYLGLERYYNYSKLSIFNTNVFNKAIFSFITFNLICITWIFFRAKDLNQSIYFLQEIFYSSNFFKLNIQDFNVFSNILLVTTILIVVEYSVFKFQNFQGLSKRFHPIKLAVFNSFFVLLILLFGISKGSQFIYFQF